MAELRKTEIWDELQNMKPIKVKLGQVYLDPNNPRFAPAGREKVLDKHIPENGVQEGCLKDIAKTGISALMNSIRASGFWVVDRIVLRRLPEEQYVVIEGNRRIAALKVLFDEHRERHTLPPTILTGIEEFEALVYLGDNPDIAWIVQGFRHTPGIEPWQRYTQAKFLSDYEKRSGRTPREIALTFGIRPAAKATTLIRAYHGFEQAKSDEDWGEMLTPDQFGFFDEVIFSKPTLKEWLGWSDDQRKFSKTENLREFLSWLPGEDKTRTTDAPLTISPATRDTLSRLVQPDQKKLFERFRGGELSIKQCAGEIDKVETRREPIDMLATIASLQEVKNTIALLPIPVIQRAKTKEELKQKNQILEVLEEIAEILAKQIKNLK